MKYKNYYEILEVNRKSSDQDIKLNFRRLAKEYHPDKNKEEENMTDKLQNTDMVLQTLNLVFQMLNMNLNLDKMYLMTY